MACWRPLHHEETQLTFAQWLARQVITAATHRELVRFFARVAHFTLSVDLDQVGYGEVAETLKNMLRYGPPGIVNGGCAAVAGALEARLCLPEPGRGWGAAVCSMITGFIAINGRSISFCYRTHDIFQGTRRV